MTPAIIAEQQNKVKITVQPSKNQVDILAKNYQKKNAKYGQNSEAGSTGTVLAIGTIFQVDVLWIQQERLITIDQTRIKNVIRVVTNAHNRKDAPRNVAPNKVNFVQTAPRVYKNIFVVGFIKFCFTSYCRYAYTIPISTDTWYNTIQ